MTNRQLIGCGLLALVAAVILYHTWQWIIGALAIVGAVFVLNQIINRPRS